MDVEAAAEQCMLGFTALAECGLTTFYLKGRSKVQALMQPFVPTMAGLRILLEKGENRRDVDRAIIKEVGYSLSLWSGGSDDESYSVSAQLGASSRFVKNCFVINLPPAGPFSLTGHEPLFENLRSRLADVFKPDTTALTLQ